MIIVICVIVIFVTLRLFVEWMTRREQINEGEMVADMIAVSVLAGAVLAGFVGMIR